MCEGAYPPKAECNSFLERDEEASTEEVKQIKEVRDGRS